MRPVILILAAGCDPRVCGSLYVGGGDAELTIRPEATEPWSMAFEGSDLASLPPSVGAWMDRGPTEEEPVFVEGRRELTASENPCGQESAVLEFLVTWTPGPNGRVETFSVVASLYPDDARGTYTVFPAWTAFGGLSGQGGDRIELESTIVGHLDARGSIDLTECVRLPAGPAEIEVSWAFDPDVAADTFYVEMLEECGYRGW